MFPKSATKRRELRFARIREFQMSQTREKPKAALRYWHVGCIGNEWGGPPAGEDRAGGKTHQISGGMAGAGENRGDRSARKRQSQPGACEFPMHSTWRPPSKRHSRYWSFVTIENDQDRRGFRNRRIGCVSTRSILICSMSLSFRYSIRRTQMRRRSSHAPRSCSARPARY